jgi:hypothetical protein
MASTATELAKDVLLKLSRIDAVDDPSAEDLAYITRVQKMEVAQLRKRQIAYWTYNSIPDEVYNSFVDYIAACVGNQYGVAISPAEKDAARDVLATDAKPRFTGAKLKTDYPFGIAGKRFDFTSGT